MRGGRWERRKVGEEEGGRRGRGGGEEEGEGGRPWRRSARGASFPQMPHLST